MMVLAMSTASVESGSPQDVAVKSAPMISPVGMSNQGSPQAPHSHSTAVVSCAVGEEFTGHMRSMPTGRSLLIASLIGRTRWCRPYCFRYGV